MVRHGSLIPDIGGSNPSPCVLQRVAQLVECRFWKPEVAGSSPAPLMLSRSGANGRRGSLRNYFLKVRSLPSAFCPSSSTVERLAVNQRVDGSTPSSDVCGQVAERSKAVGCKPIPRKGFGGSNPSLPSLNCGGRIIGNPLGCDPRLYEFEAHPSPHCGLDYRLVTRLIPLIGRFNSCIRNHANIVQLVELLPSKQRVRGSSPLVRFLCWSSSMVELTLCKRLVGGSSPLSSFLRRDGRSVIALVLKTREPKGFVGSTPTLAFLPL